MSRLHSGQFPLRSRPFDLAALAARGVAAFRDRLGSGHTLTVETACGDCPLVGDPDRLEQVLTNLLENAVKYSPDGSPIRVTVRPDDAGMLLAVRDEGIGLLPGLAEAIFVPFGRAPNAAGRQIPGLGRDRRAPRRADLGGERRRRPRDNRQCVAPGWERGRPVEAGARVTARSPTTTPRHRPRRLKAVPPDCTSPYTVMFSDGIRPLGE